MPLRYLFVDMNAYFASVEQQDDPRLRGRPVAVVPMLAENTSCLAVSYEGKAKGVKTGTPVWEARIKCPDMAFRVGRHDRYVEVHHGIVQAVGRCIPVAKVMSVDEMACKLLGEERTPAKACAIARNIKAEIRTRVGEYLKCSIGVGPSVMLAKVAGDMKKPDGLTLIEDHDLTAKLTSLKLIDFPGIGRQMEKRFYRHGITTTEQLLRLTAQQLSLVWGSRVHGERWYHLLRGEDVPEKATKRRTLGHSHVLPPELRTDAGAYGVFSRLIHKAGARLRTIGYWAGALSISVNYLDRESWDAYCHLPRCQDTLTMLRCFGDLWKHRPDDGRLLKIGMVLTDLVPARSATPSLFEHDRQSTTISHVMDKVNRTFGKNALRFGTVFGSEDTAPSRIAFSQIPEFNPAFS